MTKKGDKNLISVIIPVYKTPWPLLCKAVESILEQDYGNLELIIVEDPDHEVNRTSVSPFHDPRIIHILKEERTSFAHQLNLGLAQSGGCYVARMDADDISEPSRLRQQLRFLQSHPEISVIGTNLKIMRESGEMIGLRYYPESPERIAREMSFRNPLAHPSVMFRKEDVMAVGGFCSEFGVVADYDLWCRMLQVGKKFYNLQEPLLRYRIHSQSSKVTSLKKTIEATLQIKGRYFRGRKDLWGPKEAARYYFEKLLLFMPSSLVFQGFLLSSVKKPSTK